MSHIGILSRRFLLKLAQDPDAESLLKKRLGDPSSFQDPVFEHLVQKGIIPIIAPRKSRYDGAKETAHLGAGMYSQVYEVSYKGKLAVAKITDSQKDFDIMLKLDALRPKLGSDAKHLPIILDKLTIPPKDATDPNTTTKYVIVVEKLEPLNHYLVGVLFGNDKAKFNVAKSNTDLVATMEKLIKEIKETYGWERIDKDIQVKILELVDSAFRKSLLSAKNGQDFIYIIRHHLLDIKNKLVNDVHYDYIDNVISRIPGYIENIIGYKRSFPYFGRNVGDEDRDETALHFKESPEAKSFMKFLLRLRSEFGINWGDLHENNIMVRPSTGDLIVSDSGYFEGVK